MKQLELLSEALYSVSMKTATEEAEVITREIDVLLKGGMN